jgi:hypothetical protein
VPAEGELIYTTDTKRVYIGDGFTIGGIDVSSGGSGLGGALTSNLDLNNHNITGVGDISISGLIVTDQEFRGDLKGDVVGDVLGNVVGTVTGELEGSVFGAGSTLLVDGDNNLIVGDVSGSIVDSNGNYVIDNTLNVPIFYGSVAGDLIGDVYGAVIAPDSVVLVNPDTATLSTRNLKITDDTIIGSGNIDKGDAWKTGSNSLVFIGDNDNPNSLAIHTDFNDGFVLRGLFDPIEDSGFGMRFQASRGTLSSPLPLQQGDRPGGIVFTGYLESSAGYELLSGVTPIMENVTQNAFECSMNFLIRNAAGSLKTAGLHPDGSFKSSIFSPRPYADASDRDNEITNPQPGMIVFLTDGDGAGNPKFQGYLNSSSGWVNLN